MCLELNFLILFSTNTYKIKYLVLILKIHFSCIPSTIFPLILNSSTVVSGLGNSQLHNFLSSNCYQLPRISYHTPVSTCFLIPSSHPIKFLPKTWYQYNLRVSLRACNDFALRDSTDTSLLWTLTGWNTRINICKFDQKPLSTNLFTSNSSMKHHYFWKLTQTLEMFPASYFPTERFCIVGSRHWKEFQQILLSRFEVNIEIPK